MDCRLERTNPTLKGWTHCICARNIRCAVPQSRGTDVRVPEDLNWTRIGVMMALLQLITTSGTDLHNRKRLNTVPSLSFDYTTAD